MQTAGRTDRKYTRTISDPNAVNRTRLILYGQLNEEKYVIHLTRLLAQTNIYCDQSYAVIFCTVYLDNNCCNVKTVRFVTTF